MTAIVFAAALTAVNTLAPLPPWRDPAVNSINRLPARALLVPTAPNGEKWELSLDGEWNFKWKANADEAWTKSGKIAVPSCWQLQGDYDPPLYTNSTYPLGFDGSGDPTIDPPSTNYTSQVFRTPVGLYSRTFSVPENWRARRTVIRFLGVSSAYYVRVNGVEVGYAEDSRLPDEFDISAALKDGENTLEVEVYKHCDGSYLEDQDFWRLSGIFRSVSLVSEAKDAVKDLVVETWLAEDYSVGLYTLKDETGRALKTCRIEEPKLWSPENPNLYTDTIVSGGDNYTVTFGFRRIEIKNSVIYLNGDRILFKGVNRHEMEPETGYTVTEKGMEKDLELFREFNVNAVRNCHYPNVPVWYDKTDSRGFMVVCEANVEAHGVPNYYGSNQYYLPCNPLFHDAIVERNVRMVKFYRNHPSILIWSLGNESGDGPAMVDAYKAIKAIDPTRPVQYEAAGNAAHTDIRCPMYMRPWDCEKYVKEKPAKPFVLCEYTHAMGNSNGGVHKYWELAKKYPSFQGGFVWDFQDQAIYQTLPDGTKRLAYGGDFGDQPNDDNFNCNGLFDACRKPHPGAYELKHAYQPIHVTSYDPEKDEAIVECDLYESSWTNFTHKVTKNDDGVLFEFFDDDGRLVAWDQVVAPFVPRSGEVKIVGAGDRSRFMLNFWRAPTDNDRGWNMQRRCRLWQEATELQRLPKGVKSDLLVLKLDDGSTLVDWTLVVPKGLPPLPRVGLTLTIPKTDAPIVWNGFGPWENYSDRSEGAILATHTLALKDFNPDNYIEPGEQGYRTNTRWLMIGDFEVEALSGPFGFNVWPYPQVALETARHMEEVKETDSLTINIDAAMMGVGGDDSWGATPHPEYMLGDGTYHLIFKVKGL